MSLTKVSGSMIQGWQVTPEEFGCVGDGVADDSAAMAAACNYCCLTGATLWMSPKVYKNADVEVHGTFNVYGNGATINRLGVGQYILRGEGTGVNAIPTPMPPDPSWSPLYPATTKYELALAANKSDTTLTLVSATGIVAGMYLFIAGNPSSSSTPTNYIPCDFEFLQVESVAGNVVTLQQPLQSNYLTVKSGVFYTPGLAIHCTVDGLNISGTTEAYLLTVRGSIGCTISNILFSGTNNPGASSFSDNLNYSNITIEATDLGSFSTGRGIVSAAYQNIHVKNYGSNGFFAFFTEESFYKISVTNLMGTGILASGNVDITGDQRPRTLTFDNCIINSNAYGGVYGAFTFGTMKGVDVTVSNSVLQGAVVTPNSAIYPSITGDAMVWMSSNSVGDLLTFQNCKFISANNGNTWPSAIGGFLGTVRFDPLCTFVNCTAPSQIVPFSEKGAWTPTVFGATTAGTTTYTQQDGAYSREGNLVTVTFEVAWSAASGTGDVKIGGLPFVADADNFGIVPIYAGTVAIANAVGFKVTGSSNTALGYAALTATGRFVGVITYII